MRGLRARGRFFYRRAYPRLERLDIARVGDRTDDAEKRFRVGLCLCGERDRGRERRVDGSGVDAAVIQFPDARLHAPDESIETFVGRPKTHQSGAEIRPHDGLYARLDAGARIFALFLRARADIPPLRGRRCRLDIETYIGADG